MSLPKEEIPGAREGARIATAHTAERDTSVLMEGLEKIALSPEERAIQERKWQDYLKQAEELRTRVETSQSTEKEYFIPKQEPVTPTPMPKGKERVAMLTDPFGGVKESSSPVLTYNPFVMGASGSGLRGPIPTEPPKKPPGGGPPGGGPPGGGPPGGGPPRGEPPGGGSPGMIGFPEGPGMPKPPKPTPPTPFDGNRENWGPFVVKVYLYFNGYPYHYRLDQPQARCLQFLRWFEGPVVKTWAYGLLATIGTPHESPLLSNWVGLLEEAARLWGPINEPQTARAKLRDLKQEKTVSEYHAMFTRWAVPSGYNQIALAEMFYQRLKPTIKDLMVHIERPETVTGLLGVAIQYEQSILTRVRERGPWQVPRDRREIPKAGIRASRLAPAEIIRRLKEGTCFVCNQKGHLAQDCPQRQKLQVQATGEEETKKGEDFQEG